VKRFLNGVAVAIAVFAIALTLPNFLSPMQAQYPPILLSQNVNFPPPDVRDPDNRRRPMRAGGCGYSVADLSIIPLMPPTNIGLTVAE
jgi:hypothetical protein